MLFISFTSIAVPTPDVKGLLQAKGADKFSPPGNGTAAASTYATAMVAPVDVGYDSCFEGQNKCKKWCAKNSKPWLNKCAWSMYCAGCTPCASVDDEQAFCLTVTAPWATKCAWATCHGHAQCSDGTVPSESESSCSENIVFNPNVVLKDGTTKSLQETISICFGAGYSEACYITNVGCAPNAWDVSAVKDMQNTFYNAKSFDQDLADWDVSAVTAMSSVFYYAESFNQDLADWDVSAVTAIDAYMFKDCPMPCSSVPTKLQADSECMS
jgi:surface protein